MAALLAFGGLVVAAAIGVVGLSAGELVVIGLRLAVPLAIFRFPLAGGVAAMLLDAVDVVLVDVMQLGGFAGHYAALDKLLDSYYYAIEMLVALRWPSPWARAPALVLFGHRMVGAALFEVLGVRALLFAFPNLFENWWLYCTVVGKWFPRLEPRGWRGVVAPMALLLVPKLAQEYLLHVLEAQPWNWTRDYLLAPLGIVLGHE